MPVKRKSAATSNSAKTPRPRMTLTETMSELEKAGSAQTRKTYTRHGAVGPMFGVSFAALKTLVKRIGVDHELALELWDTGNHDARTLALKVADPARINPADLDRWAQEPTARMCGGYVAHLAAESPHARAKADQWLAARDNARRCVGWGLVGALAMLDEATPDAWFAQRLADIEKTIHEASNEQRDAMNRVVIAIGCRSTALRKQATAVAKRIGKLEVDYGDTDCKTPDAMQHIDKSWTHSTSKGFASPAAHERSRESMRTRC